MYIGNATTYKVRMLDHESRAGAQTSVKVTLNRGAYRHPATRPMYRNKSTVAMA